MGWTVQIGEGGTAYTISTDAAFNIEAQAIPRDGGGIDALEYTCEIEGYITGATASAVADNFVDLMEEVTEKFTARRVQIALDGTTKFDWTTTDGFAGPYVTLVRSEGEKGNWDSKTRYRAVISYRARASGGGDALFELSTSLAVTTVNGEIVRKVWRASAKSNTAATALSKIMKYKPNEPNITQEIERFFKEGRATAVWVWDSRNAKGFLSHKCTVTSTGWGRGWIEQKQAGKDKEAILFRKRNSSETITVKGVILGLDPAKLESPEDHFTESDTLKRDLQAETFYDVEIEDPVRGIYKLEYMEVWRSIGPSQVANHHGHDKITFKTPPSDGQIAAS